MKLDIEVIKLELEHDAVIVKVNEKIFFAITNKKNFQEAIIEELIRTEVKKINYEEILNKQFVLINIIKEIK